MSRRRKVAAKRNQSAATSDAALPWFYEPIGVALILLATFVAYLPALNGQKLWDDDAHLTAPELQSFHGLYRIWFELGATQQYYPLLHSAFWLEHKLWGDSMLGYHLVNLLWHLVAVVLVFLNVKKLKVPGALLAAAIFALHPVMVESVAWISEQKNTLSAVFYLSAMLVYLDFDESRRRSFYVLALGLFTLGLLTKTVTATLPAALLVVFWWQRGRISWKREVLPLLPFFILGAVAGLLTAWIERTMIGAEGSAYELTLLERGLLAGRVIWFYLGKLVWPANHIFIYPRWEIDPDVWWQWLFPAATLGVLILLWARRRKSRGPLAAWLSFCGTLFPVLGFLNVYPFIYSFVADHFQYLASLGMIVLAAAAVASAMGHLPKAAGRAVAALGICAVAALAVLTWRQSRMYADAATLYATTIERNSECWMVYNNLGLTLQEKGDYAAAIQHFESATRINPRSAKAYSNLGRALTDVGRTPQAIDALQKALALKPSDAVVHNNLAAALIHAGQLAEARQQLEQALQLKPDYAEAHDNMGLVLGFTGQVPAAIEQFQLALALNPNHANAHNNWGMFLSQGGSYQEAAGHFEQAIQLQPNRVGAHRNLAEALRLMGRANDAIEQYLVTLKLSPNNMEACAGLAQALAHEGRSTEAVSMANKAIALARSAGQQEAAKKMEDWLRKYQADLGRGADPSKSLPSPP